MMQKYEHNFFAWLPGDFPEEICVPLQNGAQNLLAALNDLDVNGLNLSEYNKRYFSDYKRKLFYSIECGVYLLALGAQRAGKPFHQLTIMDHGAGLGMICLLARSSGVGKVVYSDVYDVSCIDAAQLASALKLSADAYFCGQTDEVCRQSIDSGLVPDLVVSRNVVEHVYDLEDFFQQVALLPNKHLHLVVATTANPANPLVDVYTRRIQRIAEYKGTSGKWGKDRDAARPFRLIRADLIRASFPNMDEPTVDGLVNATRGLWKEDVINVVREFLRTGVMPKPQAHPTNTCDPLTGNRTEHLMPAGDYLLLARKVGWNGKVMSGFYNTRYLKTYLNPVARFVNRLIRLTGFRFPALAPFVVFAFTRSRN